MGLQKVGRDWVTVHVLQIMFTSFHCHSFGHTSVMKYSHSHCSWGPLGCLVSFARPGGLPWPIAFLLTRPVFPLWLVCSRSSVALRVCDSTPERWLTWVTTEEAGRVLGEWEPGKNVTSRIGSNSINLSWAHTVWRLSCTWAMPYFFFLPILDTLSFLFWSVAQGCHPTHKCSLLLPRWCFFSFGQCSCVLRQKHILKVVFWIPVLIFKSDFLRPGHTFLDSGPFSVVPRLFWKSFSCCELEILPASTPWATPHPNNGFAVVKPSYPVTHRVQYCTAAFFNLILNLLSGNSPVDSVLAMLGTHLWWGCPLPLKSACCSVTFSAFRSLAWSGRGRGSFWAECFCSSVTHSYFQRQIHWLRWLILVTYVAQSWKMSCTWTNTKKDAMGWNLTHVGRVGGSCGSVQTTQHQKQYNVEKLLRGDKGKTSFVTNYRACEEPLLSEKPFACKEEQKTSRSVWAVTSQKATHSKRKTQSPESGLALHIGQMHYKCNECGESFQPQGHACPAPRESTLEKKPYECSECGKAFSTPATLVQHQENPHTQEKSLTSAVNVEKPLA